MTNALAIYKDFDGLQRAAMALAKSGYFSDVKSEAQAIVKVMAGAEVGIAPFASMAGINIIEGKPAFGSNLIASLVENDPRYDYKVKKCDDTGCTLEWFKNGEKQGESSFTAEEARRVKYWNKKKGGFVPLAEKFNYQNFPSDMYFARAITRGQKRYAPGIGGGAPIYTADELGADENENGYIEGEMITVSEVKEVDHSGKWIDQELAKVEPAEVGEPEEYDFTKIERPYDALQLRAALAKKVSDLGEYNASDKQRNFLGSLLNEFFQDDTKRHEACEWLFGYASTKDMKGAQVKKALDWLNPQKDDGGAYLIDATAKTELSHVLAKALKAQGQQALL